MTQKSDYRIRFAAVVVLLLVNSICFGQTQKTLTWLQKNVVPISTTDQYQNNSHEFKKLKEILKGKDLVLLGEEDHVFSTTFEAKTKLVKFLHDEMGFSVLAFEYDVFALSKGYEKAVKENNPKVLQNTLWAFWGRSKSTESLFPYVLAAPKNKPLKVIGFDSQTMTDFPFADEVVAYLAAKNSPITKYDYYQKFTEIFKTVFKDLGTYQYKLTEPDKLLLFNVLDDILFEMELDSNKSNQFKILRQSVINFKNNVNNQWLDRPSSYAMFGQPPPDKSVYGFTAERQSMGALNRRDKAMAENIKWIKEVLYPGEKIIIWAATEHTMNNRHLAKFHNILADSNFPFHSRFKYNQGFKTMGTYIKEFYGEKAYNLGFTTLGGKVNYDRSGNNPQLADLSTAEGILESFFARLPMKNGILNLDKQKTPKEITDDKLFHNFIGGMPNTSGNISNFFDGIFFIREMKPLEYFKTN